MTGEGKPGDASADKWRETFEKGRKESDTSITRLEVRAEMKSSGEDEISSVIDQRTLEAQNKKESESPPSGYSKQVTWIIRSVKSPYQVIGLALLVGLAAWYMWLHRH